MEYVGFDPRYGFHFTAGSYSANWALDLMSRVGAAGRIALIDAVAGISPRALSEEETAAIVLNSSDQRSIVGTSVQVLDIPAKTRGEAK